MNCPNCGKDNPAGSRFCQFCGSAMSTGVATSSVQSPVKASLNPAIPATPLSPSDRSAGQIGQIGSGGKSATGIWGPFAGYGTRGRHASWLLDDLGERAEALHEAVTQRFNQRQVPSSQMKWQTLVAKGLLVERRPFYFVQRGITTVALYIARFGKDIYISQVTYVKGPISNARVALLFLMLLFQLYFMFGFTRSLVGSLAGFDPIFGTGSGLIPIVFLLCLIAPLGAINSFAWLLILAYSVYKFVTEKDFLAILRALPNEFQYDDTVALEKAVEETVRQSLDAIGIDVNLMPPSQERSAADLFRKLGMNCKDAKHAKMKQVKTLRPLRLTAVFGK